MPIIIAHRGNQKLYDNSIFDAFDSAFEKGVDGIEFDVQVDENNIPIVVHDYLFDRTKKYPFLSEILEKYKNKGRLEIEVKGFEKDGIISIVNEIKKHNLSNFEVTTAEPPVSNLLSELLPNSNRGLMIRESLFSNWMTEDHINRIILGYMKLTNSNVLHLDLDIYNLKLIALLQKYKIKTHALLETDSKEYINKISEYKIDICSISNLELLELILSNK